MSFTLDFVHLPLILVVLSKSVCVVAFSRQLWYLREIATGYFYLSFQVSKAAWQEKRFQDYNERCIFHHHGRVRPPLSFADADSVPLALVSRTASVVYHCMSPEAKKQASDPGGDAWSFHTCSDVTDSS